MHDRMEAPGVGGPGRAVLPATEEGANGIRAIDSRSIRMYKYILKDKKRERHV